MSDYSVKIKCGSCERNKAQQFFSKTSLAKFRESQRLNARNPKHPIKSINCTACNVGGRDELECCMCNRVMALDKFNKSQRRKGDNAHCQDCAQEKIDREPDHEKEVEEVVIIDELKKSEIGDYSFHSSRLSSAARSRLASTNSRLETDTNPGSDNWFAGNDAVSLAGTQSSTYSSTATRPKTGTGWDGFAGDNRSVTGSHTGSNAGFAKSNAVPRDQIEKARAQLERQQRRTQEQDEVVRDESDESDDDEDPY